jgi:hypothetical protein
MKVIKTGVLFVVLAALVFCLVRASDKMGSGQQAESLKQLDASIRKATMTCYATEGVYPPSVQYLKENYGIQIDEDRYSVFYEIEGANLMPSITVMEND